MDSHKLGIKVFLADGTALSTDSVVPLFHGWIQRKAIADHLLIDVADYGHVPNGPGVVLIAHEANYSLDCANGRAGLLYTRKQPCGATLEYRLRYCLAAALQASQLLERETLIEPKVRFQANEIVVRIYDRLLAPNTPETFAAVGPALRSALSRAFDCHVELRHSTSPDTVFEVVAKSATAANVTALLNRLGQLA